MWIIFEGLVSCIIPFKKQKDIAVCLQVMLDELEKDETRWKRKAMGSKLNPDFIPLFCTLTTVNILVGGEDISEAGKLLTPVWQTCSS